jgi:pimeloyl-ACP methyl ester carboxylesterase
MANEVRLERISFAGHAVSYAVLGEGSPVVVLKPHGGPWIYAFASALAGHYTVIQVDPLGYAHSEGVAEHGPGDVHEQIHTVLDQDGVDRFVVWGYSLGGAMAVAVAHASRRVTAMVCGGWSPAERISEARLRRMDRSPRLPDRDRVFWHWHSRFDWLKELSAMQMPRLVYVGTDDPPRVRGPRGIPRTKSALEGLGVQVLEFDGLDHATCMNEPAFSAYAAIGRIRLQLQAQAPTREISRQRMGLVPASSDYLEAPCRTKSA